MFRCIGRKRINNRRNDRTELVQCTAESETPSNPEKPQWGWLCTDCASERKGPKSYEEPVNVGFTQCDAEEYRDQISAGFAFGARRGYEDSSEGDEE